MAILGATNRFRHVPAVLAAARTGDPQSWLQALRGLSRTSLAEAVLWLARTGSPWRDLHREFGNWNSVFKRFRRWALKGVFEKIFESLSGDPDFEYAIIDGTIVRVHQHGTGARGGLKIRPLDDRAAV